MNYEEKKNGQSNEENGRRMGRIVFQIFFLLLGNAVLLAGIWQQIHFGGMSVAAMVFQLTVPMEGADTENFTGLFLLLGIGTPVLIIGEMCLSEFIRRRWQPKRKFGMFFRNRPVGRAAIWFGLITLAVLMRMQVFTYMFRVMFPSSLYEDYYVKASDVDLKAPEKPRNLIYIYLESMEVTYSDQASGGVAAKNRIPFLTELSGEGCNFSVDGRLNGMLPVEGALWTCGSLVSQTSGTPLTVPIGRNNMGKGYQEFLPGAEAIGEILKANGYEQVFLQGSEIRFAGTDTYLKGHGAPEIRDYTYYQMNHRLPSDKYKVWWGFEDERLYNFAREEILRVAAGDRPFAVTITSIDTHFTDGYRCHLCGSEFSTQYDNVIRCADNQIRDFVEWIQQQDFYDNTTVIIVGDHPTMDSKYFRKLAKGNRNYQRRTYTLILNSAQEFALGKNRSYCAFDMFPTTLAALGFEISGNRLGLGVNLYSEEPTLIEQMGLKKLNKELVKHSKYYNRYIVAKE